MRLAQKFITPLRSLSAGSCARPARAFALFDLLVATSVLITISSVFFTLYRLKSNALEEGENRFLAQQIIKNQIHRLRAQKFPSTYPQPYRFSLQHPQLGTKLEATVSFEPAQAKDLVKVFVRVRWKNQLGVSQEEWCLTYVRKQKG
ncbi:MAG: hypothetical protein D6805_06975 [Planctomycetota bacterium]|nr:MAG: hypothetical protein D6805_06975 [Planctomycetota bacterium]